MTQKNFDIALNKGAYAEKLVQDFLEDKGYICYYPQTKNKAHIFDILATRNKDEIIAIDVKAKTMLNKYPMTGIDFKHYIEYKNIADMCKIPFYLVFVDENAKLVYGQELNQLGEPDMMMAMQKIVLWEVSKMATWFELNNEQCLNLKHLSQRNYEYMLN